VFAIALYAAGQSSAITGVLAGRILTRGFRGRESRAWLRGIVTRIIAVAIGFVLMTRGGGQSPDQLLVLSQVVLSLALPFALTPLVAIAARRDLMGRLALGRPAIVAAAAVTALIVGLDLYLLADAVL
jgi:manganese transport protein